MRAYTSGIDRSDVPGSGQLDIYERWGRGSS